MKLAVKVGQSVEAMGKSEWRSQVAQVEYGADFPEKIKLMIGPGDNPLAAGEYTVELARAIQRRSVITEGGRPGSRVSRDMLVIDIRASDLVAVSVKPSVKVA